MSGAIHYWTDEQSAALKMFLRRSPLYKNETGIEAIRDLEDRFLFITSEVFSAFKGSDKKLGKLKADDVKAIRQYQTSIKGLPNFYITMEMVDYGWDVGEYLLERRLLLLKQCNPSETIRRATPSTVIKSWIATHLEVLCRLFQLNFTSTQGSDVMKLIELLCQYADITFVSATAKHLIDDYKKQQQASS